MCGRTMTTDDEKTPTGLELYAGDEAAWNPEHDSCEVWNVPENLGFEPLDNDDGPSDPDRNGWNDARIANNAVESRMQQ